MKARPREFRPTMPKLRERLTVLVFGLLTLGNMVGWIRGRGSAAFVVSFLMLAGGTWLYYRLRVFGSPTLSVDRKGFRYSCGSREVSAAWSEIANVGWNFDRDEIRFIRKDGGRPVIISIDMTTAEGERFDNLVEDYWKPPAGQVRRAHAPTARSR